MQINGQQQTRLAMNASFLAFIQGSTNELLLYDAGGFGSAVMKEAGAGDPTKMTCMARLKPT